MKAPDKIYLAESDKGIGEITNFIANRRPFLTSSNIEYIRKDALLEWLKGAISDIIGINYEEDNYEAGTADAYQEVINKLNSM